MRRGEEMDREEQKEKIVTSSHKRKGKRGKLREVLLQTVSCFPLKKGRSREREREQKEMRARTRKEQSD